MSTVTEPQTFVLLERLGKDGKCDVTFTQGTPTFVQQGSKVSITVYTAGYKNVMLQEVHTVKWIIRDVD